MCYVLSYSFFYPSALCSSLLCCASITLSTAFRSPASIIADGHSVLTLSLLLQSAGITRSLMKGGDMRVDLGEDAARVQARYLGRPSRSISRTQLEKDLARPM